MDDDIIRMAREAGFLPNANPVMPQLLARFADLVRADERESCARVCDVTPPYPFRPSIEAAHAIRARGHQPPTAVADRLARHGIPMPEAPACPDCRGIGYDASGQLCGCQGNPSF